MFALSGCKNDIPQTNVTVTPEMNTTEPEKQPVDVVEKRGIQTNITDFNELLRRASKIATYKYNITDTTHGADEYRFYVFGRFIRVDLPELEKYSDGTKYDQIFLDRVTKHAFSKCSINHCPRPNLDKELENTEFDDYYISDPMETLYKATKAEYVKEEMLGNDYAKVFSIKYEGNDARLWLQEYYGYPLKLVIKTSDNTKRTITFTDMQVDATRRGEIDLPTNFTIKGEEGSWFFWEHYLGLWPPEGSGLKSGELNAISV